MSNAPLRVLHQQGQQALSAGNLQQALSLLQQAAARTNAREAEYGRMLSDLRATLLQLRRPRHALTVDWYRGDSQSESQLLEHVPKQDQARTLQAWAERGGGNSQEYWTRAASLYEDVGMIAHASICREHAGDHRAAQALWSRLGDAIARMDSDRYAAGLARFNLSRCCEELDDARAARSALVSAVHMLEEAADRYERIGQRERAFDCYQVLIAVGKQSGEFEHVLEGYVNVVRILREDSLRFYALQSYEEALAEADAKGEHSAGATLAQEMASYAHSQGMLAVGNHATGLGAHMWQRVAESVIERGGPSEMAENALLAAIVSLARQGQFRQVGMLYETLAELELEPARQQHYSRAAQRYAGVRDASVEASPLPSHLRQDAAFPDVWHVDLVEWEQKGSASLACGDVVLAPETWSEVTRRRAMMARMQALDVEALGQRAEASGLVELAQTLGQVELYTILAPLEHLYRHPSPEVRMAVVHALERFMYKRTFPTVRAALDDSDARVQDRARKTLEQLRFPHAFDPLARIFRESDDSETRAAAVRAIARIDTDQAAELLVGVFQHEGRQERLAAADALKRARGSRFLDVARSAMPTLGEHAQAALRDVFHARGEML